MYQVKCSKFGCYVLFLIALFLFAFNYSSYSQKQIAITFDDLPAALPRVSLKHTVELNKKLLSSLKKQEVPAIGFVNESMVDVYGEADERTDILRLWVNQGFELGNHTYTHKDYNSTNFNKFKEEIIKGGVLTNKVLSEKHQEIKYFRPPFLTTGATEEAKERLEHLLTEKKYIMALATVESSDFVFNLIYLKAKLQNDTAKMNVITDKYIEFTSKRLDYYEDLAEKVVGAPIPQIYLCHLNDLNADNINKLLLLFKKRGYSFISLDEALSHPVYQREDTYVGSKGLSWLLRWSTNKNRKQLLAQMPEVDSAVRADYNETRKNQFWILLPARVEGVSLLTKCVTVLVGFAFLFFMIIFFVRRNREVPKQNIAI
ncbi:polysaccharide deacetylase family protein [Pontibacter silvestris]|uniref:Polysaccharide deacetylase family protein n=1 Tax=Pontibacter silvestris TaxID=2305183 RepID=A0ABW4WWV6_9BACT|nr:polysaccharide deacetylase family protein [Pontibacter silvestris]MCC9138830.1 polysaccharide deacetylase family protein [Pontibacter silvestris]